MDIILIVIHLMIVLALIGVVLLQRSEGGGLGIGGGSGFMTARGASNALTRATAILAAAFFATSLALSILARYGDRPTDILDRVPVQEEGQAPRGEGSGGVLDQLGGPSTPAAPAVPQEPAVPTAPTGEAPATPSGTAPATPSGEAPAAQPAPSEPAPPANGATTSPTTGEGNAPAATTTPQPAAPATEPQPGAQ